MKAAVKAAVARDEGMKAAVKAAVARGEGVKAAVKAAVKVASRDEGSSEGSSGEG
jgi:hypothetical protein